ncbi:MAG: hypothetical protein IPG10_20490 [Flavobacteriales bacterium]|nr:hypothetical protein [Flavobacteriales bacterium]
MVQPFSPVGIGVSYPNGSDMVVARLSNDGSQLLGSTYLGGSLNDGHNSGVGLRYNYADEMRGEVLLDAEERVYVISCTQSADFPMTAGSPQPAFGGGSHDGVVARFDASLSLPGLEHLLRRLRTGCGLWWRDLRERRSGDLRWHSEHQPPSDPRGLPIPVPRR